MIALIIVLALTCPSRWSAKSPESCEISWEVAELQPFLSYSIGFLWKFESSGVRCLNSIIASGRGTSICFQNTSFPFRAVTSAIHFFFRPRGMLGDVIDLVRKFLKHACAERITNRIKIETRLEDIQLMSDNHA